MSSLNYRFLSGRTELGMGSIGLMAVTKALSLARAAKRVEDGVEEELLAELARQRAEAVMLSGSGPDNQRCVYSEGSK